jgi:formylglycine-generating enzyme required for sulfatase activity
MNGNLWEWNEAIIGASTRCIRGAAWNNGGTYLAAISRTSQNTTYFLNNIGLRLATLTNPYSFNTFVDIIDTGNTQDSNGYGAVSYSYKINQYLVTNDQYIEFLNAVAQTDDNGLYPSIMSTDLRSGIIRSGTNGSYAYAARTNMNNKPVNFMSWYNTARFANWLHNNKPNGLQNNSTTEGGAYQLTGNTGQPSRDFGAKYFIPTENEWYKAAYYKAGSTNAGYWKYATRSATLPSCVSASVNGNGVTS